MSARKYPYFSQTRCKHGAGMVLASDISQLIVLLSKVSKSHVEAYGRNHRIFW
ncbi:hypothetical protein KK060_08375 [Fulvivirgaceae bacterium PWU20]|uniref:Uncharacterized protein n=1 Tax=Chryseosolibacter indicus TaxID=2782351 RepID=A0ABS5VRA8_9BACT|nr:hypothetical protein [Chryseosolibacter indicus]